MAELLKSISTVTAGNAAPAKDKFSKEGIPFVRAGSLEFLVRGISIDECEKINESLAKEKKLKLFPQGSIVFAKSGMSAKMGRIYVLPQNAYVVSHLAVITISSEYVNNNYIAYYFNFRPPVNLIKDDAYPSISISDIENIEIPLPDLEIQNKIVAILDRAQALLGKREKTIALYDELLRATFLEMFGDPVLNTKGWPKVILDQLGEWKSGGTPSRTNAGYFNGNIPWVTSGELNELYVSSTNEAITEEAIDNSNAKLIPIKSLLIGMYDTAALKSSISTIQLTCNQAIAYSQIDEEKCRILYVHTAIQIGKDFFKSNQRGARQQNLNLSLVKQISIPHPPLSLQVDFEKKYALLINCMQKALKYKKTSEALLKSLSQQVFLERITIDVEAELEALVNAIDLERTDAENKIDSVKNDVTFLQRLIDKLSEQEFEDKYQYDKAKYVLFRTMKEEKNLVKQIFKNSKVELTLQNETP